MPMVTKLVRVVTYWAELTLNNLHDLSMSWSYEIMKQIKYISPLAEDLSEDFEDLSDTQQLFICSKSAIKTLEKCEKYVQSQQQKERRTMSLTSF